MPYLNDLLIVFTGWLFAAFAYFNNQRSSISFRRMIGSEIPVDALRADNSISRRI
jgi:hypothetical protein